MSASAPFRDRIVDLRRVRAGDLKPHPRNWRTHPEGQRSALRAMLEDVGWADALLAREKDGGLELVDGHLRAGLEPDTVVPVLVLDLSDDEAEKVLLTLDPLAGMATVDAEALASLMGSVDLSSIRPLADKLARELSLVAGLGSVGDGAQSQLDSVSSMFLTCPKCGHEFKPIA